MRHKKKILKNKQGKDKYVVLTLEDYTKILAKLEDLEDIKEYDRAMSNKPEFISADEVFKQVEDARVCTQLR